MGVGVGRIKLHGPPELGLGTVDPAFPPDHHAEIIPGPRVAGILQDRLRQRRQRFIEMLLVHVNNARVIRAMPNTAAMVGRSATAYACDASVNSEDRAVAEAVFSGIGEVYPVGEKLLDAVTGLSGSGPAYVCLVIEALSDGGVACGLPRKLAIDLAVQTVLGTAEMVRATSEHPAVLREMVTSPAGTTVAGLRALETRGVRSAFIEAVRAAANRSGELSGE